MMNTITKSRISFFIILMAVFQLFNTSCSRKLQPGNSSGKIENQPEKPNVKSSSGKQVSEKFPENRNTVNQPAFIADSVTADSEKKLNTHKTNAQDIIGTAEKYLGVPHCMGGISRKCMDCSGLLVTVFREHDITLPHNAQEQSKYGVTIKKMEDLREGDLVFFTKSYKTKNYITHSGIYIGNSNFIHTSSNTGVSITSLNERYWHEKFVFGKRILQ